jgi:hypothetical protein
VFWFELSASMRRSADASNFSEAEGPQPLNRSQTSEKKCPGSVHLGQMRNCSPTSHNRGRLCFRPYIDARERRTFCATTTISAQGCEFDRERELASLLSPTKRRRERYSSPLRLLALLVALSRVRKMKFELVEAFPILIT